ncbi:MAG: hypothetical protein KDA75_06885 [Planctomycetaceae bacterium]|nr:hypothetical protein [Planctomycetaceae bacterium]
MSDSELAVAAVIAAANQQHEETFSHELVEALNRLAKLDDPHSARLAVVEHITQVESPLGAGMLALWLGAAVETGSSPEENLPALLQTLGAWCDRLSQSAAGEQSGSTILHEHHLAGLQHLGQAVVAHLARSAPGLAAASADQSFIDRLERVEGIALGAAWVLQCLRQRSGELLVIHSQARTGVRVRYENISNCFHLFTLLQAALAEVMPGAKRPSPHVLSVARGEHSADAMDSAWWDFTGTQSRRLHLGRTQPRFHRLD